MADNYQLFSEVISSLTQEERAWAEGVLGFIQHPDYAGDAEDILKSAGIAPNTVDVDDWPGFEWEFTEPGNELWLHSDNHGNIQHVALLVRAFLARFRPEDSWQLTWAETCSRPRIGEFSGGGMFVTGAGVKFFTPANWLAQQRKKFDRAAARGIPSQPGLRPCSPH